MKTTMKNFLILSLFLLLIPVFMAYSIIGLYQAFAQTTQGLKPLPQDYYVVTQPPQGVSPAIVQGLDVGTLTGLAATGAAIYNKISSDRKDAKLREIQQYQSSQIVQSKEVEHSLAKQFYDSNPEFANKIEGTAPETKLQKLADNKTEAVKIASKT